MTLAKKINIILKLSEEAGVDKEQAIKNTIDAYVNTGKYPLLEKVINDKTRLQREYNPFVEKHTGWESFLIPFKLKEEKRVAEENRGLVNPYMLISDFANLVTPVTLGALGYVGSYVVGVMVVTALSVLTGNNLFPYLLDAASGASSVIAPVCGIFGCVVKGIAVHGRKGLEKEIKMLDGQIERIYHNE